MSTKFSSLQHLQSRDLHPDTPPAMVRTFPTTFQAAANELAIFSPPLFPRSSTLLIHLASRSIQGAASTFKWNRVLCCAQERPIWYNDVPNGGQEASYCSWIQNSSDLDAYGGWSFQDPEDDMSWSSKEIAGLLRYVAGIGIAVSLALVAYSSFSRRGLLNKLYRPLTVQQLSLGTIETNMPSSNMSQMRGITNRPLKEEEEELLMEGDSLKLLDHVNTPGQAIVYQATPFVVEPHHDQALSALQTLKIAEPSSKSNDFCTKREYARWLVLASNTLARKPSERIFPASYMEGSTNLAFDDVLPEDPDFSYIQGIAEAGILLSKLSDSKSGGTKVFERPENENPNFTLFHPDSPVFRQDVVSWKVALDHAHLPSFDDKTVEVKTSFVDISRVHQNARPAVLMDFLSGEKSITALAFGHTRRFQPQQLVTKGQAAVAITSGDAALRVLEEMTRLDAEKSAEDALFNELLLENRVRKELDVEFKAKLELEKENRIAVERKAEATRLDLESVKMEREKEKLTYIMEKAAIECERELLLSMRKELVDQLQLSAIAEDKAQLEKERLKKLWPKAEERKQILFQIRSKVDTEKAAVKLARLWAEDEAQRAQMHADVLQRARKHWEILSSCDHSHIENLPSEVQFEEHPGRETLGTKNDSKLQGDTGGFQFIRAPCITLWQTTSEILQKTQMKVQFSLSKAGQTFRGLQKLFMSPSRVLEGIRWPGDGLKVADKSDERLKT